MLFNISASSCLVQVLLVVGASIGGLWWSSVHQSTSSTRSVAAHRPSLRFATTIRANCCCARLHTKLYTIQVLQIQIQIQNLQNIANWFCTRLPTKLCICLYTEEMQRIHKYRHKLCYTIILVQLQKLHICPNMVISGLHIQFSKTVLNNILAQNQCQFSVISGPVQSALRWQ